jgi:hypothetical protein
LVYYLKLIPPPSSVNLISKKGNQLSRVSTISLEIFFKIVAMEIAWTFVGNSMEVEFSY